MKEYERAEQEDGDDCRLVWIDPFRFRYSWVKRCNRDFDNYTSLEVMMLESIIGIAEVCRYLNRLRGLWSIVFSAVCVISARTVFAILSIYWSLPVANRPLCTGG
jgi:hypothetical protein